MLWLSNIQGLNFGFVITDPAMSPDDLVSEKKPTVCKDSSRDWPGEPTAIFGAEGPGNEYSFSEERSKHESQLRL